jgi:phage-related protein (TIGR01555 family)
MGFFDRFRRAPAPQLTRLRRDTSSSLVMPGALEAVTAGWTNPMTGLGQYGLDPTASLSYQAGKIPIPMIVDRLYTHDWLADRIIEKMPSVAMVRGWKVAGAESEATMKQFRALNYTERFPRGCFERGVYDGRGYGGSVMLKGYALGHPAQPLTEAHKKGGINFLDLFAQHELEVLQRFDDPNQANYGMPELYRVLNNASSGMPHPRAGQIFHSSRSIRFSGRPLRVPNTGLDAFDRTGSHAQPELGVSVLTPVLDMVGQYGLAWRAVSNMLQDASIGVMKIAGLIEALASEDRDLIEDRLRTLQQTKSVHRMMFLDVEAEEEYERKEVKLTDVPDIIRELSIAVASSAETPASIFFSGTTNGLNANAKGEADFTQFYNTCDCYRATYLGPKLNALLSAIGGGEDVEVEWPPLFEPSENEAAQTRLADAGADKIYWDMGYGAKDIGKARADGTYIELTGTAPEDDRDEVAGAGQPEEPPAGAPGKAGAAKIATKQRAAESKGKK